MELNPKKKTATAIVIPFLVKRAIEEIKTTELKMMVVFFAPIESLRDPNSSFEILLPARWIEISNEASKENTPNDLPIAAK